MNKKSPIYPTLTQNPRIAKISSYSLYPIKAFSSFTSMASLFSSSTNQTHANMTCGLKVDTQSPGWQKTITKVLTKIKGVSYTIDVEEGMAYVSGRVNPNTLLKKLAKAGKHADLCWVEAGNQFNHGNTSDYHCEDNRFLDPYWVDNRQGRTGYSYKNQYHQPYGYPQRGVPPPSMSYFDPYNGYRNVNPYWGY